MNIITTIFNALLYQPMLNILIWLHGLTGSFGLAIILLTLLIKIILHPLNKKAIQSQAITAEIQPQLKEIQTKYKDSPDKQASEMMALYKAKKFNPFSGFLVLIIQIPLLIALFQVFKNGMNMAELSQWLYPFIAIPQSINPLFLGIDLSLPNIFLAVLTAIAQYVQIKTSVPPAPKQKNGEKSDVDKMSQMMQTQMAFILPIVTFIVLFKLPAALGLYWFFTTVISIIEQKLLLNKKNK
ncbi:MAG: YidC/Oxa1 family membrane protein insertase [Candidatus Pacebacteria bacterium]|nr:YidC/Oxa1 family membrane protein insertase [Candidatus Paceibacterota bacterium]